MSITGDLKFRDVAHQLQKIGGPRFRSSCAVRIKYTTRTIVLVYLCLPAIRFSCRVSFYIVLPTYKIYSCPCLIYYVNAIVVCRTRRPKWSDFTQTYVRVYYYCYSRTRYNNTSDEVLRFITDIQTGRGYDVSIMLFIFVTVKWIYPYLSLSNSRQFRPIVRPSSSIPKNTRIRRACTRDGRLANFFFFFFFSNFSL